MKSRYLHLSDRNSMWFCLFLLALQNMGIFWQHYSGVVTFPSDFTAIYYPMTAFWTQLLKQGILPEWMTFQAMGFPFLITMQSGIFYPPLWFFALSAHLVYTLQVAAIFQGLHILFGAVGCWMYARLVGISVGAALFAAVAFQFFGGFYSNAEHSDIIHAFAFVPWLFWCTHIVREQTAVSGRNLLIPLMITLFITRAYQGNIAAQLFLVVIGAVLFWIKDLADQPEKYRHITLLYCQVAGLGLLGLGITSVYLWPMFELKPYLVRGAAWTGWRMGWLPTYWNSLFQPVNFSGIYLYSSMTSAFVTVPVFCVLFLSSKKLIRQNWVWVLLTVFAGVMAGGPNTPVYTFLLDVFPFLAYSRFPSSDYRGVLGFGLILLSGKWLDGYLAGQSVQKILPRVMLCLGLLGFYWVANSFLAWAGTPEASHTVAYLQGKKWLAMVLLPVLQFAATSIIFVENSEWFVAIVLSIPVFVSLYFLRHQRITLIASLVVLEIISASYFLNRISGQWRTIESADTFYDAMDLSQDLPVLATIRNLPSSRPACQELALFERSWEGYLKGTFTCSSKDPKTTSRDIVDRSPALVEYMHQSWKPYLLTREELATCDPEHLMQKKKQEGDAALATVRHISMQARKSIYQVNAATDFCFVENEMWFPGWSGSIGRDTSINAQGYCGALRSWCLPKGEYQVTTEYRTPGLREGVIASLVFILFYMLLCAWWWVVRRVRSKV